ncbi:hypothetical protein HD_1420 [[Haemophilus] ducreyi 35000HP]|uniref:Uncharacterized protein n=1 Tax=Haemophilus ducreyi (strain 35000HP / ATCC 700724) TaxID=233412 RepID=Q7VLK9_HAEDU|nr:hypothetical protein HD_1420 [[Haemophilus] ducreyi 35000HP]
MTRDLIGIFCQICRKLARLYQNLNLLIAQSSPE